MKDPLAKFFEEQFPNFIELQQDGFTRDHKVNGDFRSAARLDRWYCNLPELDMLDCQPRAAVLHNVFAPNPLSDHAAISLALHPPRKEVVITQFALD